MKHLKTLGAVALSLALYSGPALAADASKKMDDLEIAHTAYTAGNLDIRYAHLALGISDDENVRAFAQTMIRDHSAVNTQAVALITKLKVTPKDNDLSRALVKGAAQKRAELVGLTGKQFDCAYATNELGYHQIVNQTVEKEFIPAVTVAPLKELLKDALVTFKVHEGHAAKMVEALKCPG